MRKILRPDETSFSYERDRQPMPKIGPWQDQLDVLFQHHWPSGIDQRPATLRPQVAAVPFLGDEGLEEILHLHRTGQQQRVLGGDARYGDRRMRANGAAEALQPLLSQGGVETGLVELADRRIYRLGQFGRYGRPPWLG